MGSLRRFGVPIVELCYPSGVPQPPKRTREDNKKDKDIEAPKKPAKTKYAEFVSMTEEEYQKLRQKIGKENTDRGIDLLDNYKGSKGKIYKSDYRAILTWVIDALMKKNRYVEFDPDIGDSVRAKMIPEERAYWEKRDAENRSDNEKTSNKGGEESMVD